MVRFSIRVLVGLYFGGDVLEFVIVISAVLVNGGTTGTNFFVFVANGTSDGGAILKCCLMA